MKNSTLHTPEQYISMPWRNGAGTTIELLKCHLPHEDDFLWRISMATVSEDGIFSKFENYHRTLVLLEGDGITLTHDDELDHKLCKPLEYAQFSGGANTTAQLHSGPIVDFNIMTRKGVCSAVTHCVHGSKEINPKSGATTLLIYAVESEVCVRDETEEQCKIPHNSLLVVQPPPEQIIQIDGTACIVVAITDSHY